MGLNFSLEYKVEAKSMGAASLPQGLYTSAFRPMQYKKTTSQTNVYRDENP